MVSPSFGASSPRTEPGRTIRPSYGWTAPALLGNLVGREGAQPDRCRPHQPGLYREASRPEKLAAIAGCDASTRVNGGSGGGGSNPGVPTNFLQQLTAPRCLDYKPK